MSTKSMVSQKAISEFCRRWKIVELSLFGSVLRDDFQPDSDIDVLVQFAPDARHSLFDMVHMQDELRNMFGREVDLVEKNSIERSHDYLRRWAILGNAEVMYAA